MMDMVLIAVGFVGSIASIVSILRVTNERRVRALHASYMLFLAIAVFGYISMKLDSLSYARQLEAILAPQQQAAAMLKDAPTKYSDQGFMLASLAFLEKHKDRFPDTYTRAEAICVQNGLLQSPNGPDSLTVAFKQIDGRSAMSSLLEGIAAGGVAGNAPGK